VAIATIAAEIRLEHERTDPNVVKVVGSAVGQRRLRALYFTRATAPSGEGPLFHHIGLYAYRARRWSASSRCRRARLKSASGSSSCARWRPACASMCAGR
jgi:CMP-2-keto-3-deoxyoctulosonic acid synthetase